MNPALLDKNGLFERLAQPATNSTANSTTVVTPNVRLAQELGREFDRYQVSRGLTLWNAPDIVPFTAFVSRAYEDALYSDGATPLPVVLSVAEEQALWESAIERSDERSDENTRLLALPQAAAAARDAWKTAHEWRLLAKMQRFPKNEDAQAFARWSDRYERVTKRDGLTDAARLPDLVAAMLGERSIAKPAALVRYAFDIETAQQQNFFAALAAQDCEIFECSPTRRTGSVIRVRCVESRDELRQAARWARARLERNPDARIGVVVPDPAKHRNALRRIFAHTMGSSRDASGGSTGVQPFNISLGEPLSNFPLVHAAFLILELAGRDTEFERASQLIRSPFIALGEEEMAGRARLDVELRRRAEPSITLDRLVALLESTSDSLRASTHAPMLAQKLSNLVEFRKRRLFGGQSPSDWGRAFSDALVLMGFPGERALDSPEYQTLKKWHTVLAQFAQLERVAPKMGYGEAVSRLRRIAADTPFQPESPDVPIQILGVLESAGCEFDHLWVMGLSVEAWPLASRPNPFLPIALQREAGIPESSADASFELDRRITQGWLGAADEVVISYPAREADRELVPSPLIADLPEAELALPAYPVFRGAIHASRVLERGTDHRAPPPPAKELSGGSFLIRDQSACPFRAFARHRLAAEGLESPHSGLDALERGSLVHQVLATAWAELGTKHGLDTISAVNLQALLERAAEAAVSRKKRERPATLTGRFAQIEKRRLARLAMDWLKLERERGDFSVFAIEDRRTLSIGDLQLRGRLDRVDETAAGERIVIDYKTGASNSVGAWLGDRPDDPQLPLYVTASETGAKAIAYAQVKAGNMKLVSLAENKTILPGARTLPNGHLKNAAESWSAQLEAWRIELDFLARSFGAGEATVDPKPKACDYCDQKPFCRIHERETALGVEDESSHDD